MRCLPNPHEKPHPFKKTKRGKKTMSRQEKKALMESKMQRTKLFKLTKVTKKERRLRQEAAAAAEPEPDSEPEPDGDLRRGARYPEGDGARRGGEEEAETKKQVVNRRCGSRDDGGRRLRERLGERRAPSQKTRLFLGTRRRWVPSR